MKELFKIYQLELDEALRIENSINHPHRHDYEELIIGLEGGIQHFIDFKSESFEAPYVCFIAQGKSHRVHPLIIDDQCRAWVIRFRSEFIPETTFQLYAYYQQQANIKFLDNSCFQRFVSLCEMMSAEMQSPQPDLAVVRQLLSSLFVMIESERKKRFPELQKVLNSQSTTFKNFLSILEDNFRRTEGVNFYAEKLFMSARNLNLICQSIMQQSVSEIIETRKLVEAKNLLMNSEKSIAEIGFEIGYQDKAYFTSVFKKKTGQTPTDFREEMNKLIS